MLVHSDLMLNLAYERQREMIAEAEQSRLLARAREARWGRKARKASVVRGQPAGTLASCDPSVAVPAR
ncbi:hypothetical protein [Actinoplanes solisilvae]|uniref:hypothetical protein n=1 Tax=Actinoplanes solisilvae TaxID=2486853 RepID=UPI000FDA90DE|nr:hypothetical protein [Actinoplanes solisilvae]